MKKIGLALMLIGFFAVGNVQADGTEEGFEKAIAKAEALKAGGEDFLTRRCKELDFIDGCFIAVGDDYIWNVDADTVDYFPDGLKGWERNLESSREARANAARFKEKHKDYAKRCKKYKGTGACLIDVGGGWYWDPKEYFSFRHYPGGLKEAAR